MPLKAGDFKTPYQVELVISSRGRDDIADEDMIYGNELTWSSVIK